MGVDGWVKCGEGELGSGGGWGQDGNGDGDRDVDVMEEMDDDATRSH